LDEDIKWIAILLNSFNGGGFGSQPVKIEFRSAKETLISRTLKNMSKKTD